ncbi:MAG: chemotaxis response regulator protein-glutamate methylesterase [Thermotogae bacterium]|nr:chemotaxis response regulator protein-glutamate methylesterase [Thermotogota bacterium]
MVEGKIRVLIADDSAMMRMVIGDIIRSQPDMEVVGFATNGIEAIEKCKELKPDVMTLDIEMPKMDGITALKHIIDECPTRVIMVSSLTEEGAAITLEALEIGAIDFVTKPGGSISMNFRTVAQELVDKIRTATKIDLKKVLLTRRLRTVSLPSFKGTVTTKKIVVVASSTGGPRSLENIIPPLPDNLPAPVVVVQHMPPNFTASLAKRLDGLSKLCVVEAKGEEELEAGTVYVAPGDYHLGLKMVNGKVKTFLEKGPKINNVRPAADFTFDKAAEIYRGGTIGVVLTGMGRDGTLGAFKIKHYGGKIIAEAKETCVVYGMPKSVVEEGYADYVLPSYRIAEKIIELLR